MKLQKVNCLKRFNCVTKTRDLLWLLRVLFLLMMMIMMFDVRGFVHHSAINKDISNKMQQCINILLFHLYEAQHTHAHTHTHTHIYIYIYMFI